MADRVDFMTGAFDFDVPEEVPDLAAVDAGEYTLEIKGLESMVAGENNYPAYSVRCSIVDQPDTKQVRVFLYLPCRQMDEDDPTLETKKKAARKLKNFTEAIGLEWPVELPFDEEALIGVQFEAYLTVKEDEEYGAQNEVRRFTARA